MKYLSLVFALLLSMSASASLEIGTGFSSSHSGRMVPTLALGISSSNFVLSGYSTGVNNEYYYHNAYGLHAIGGAKVGDLMGGAVFAGAGLGMLYAKRSFKDMDSDNVNNKEDIVVGPAFRVNWTFLNVMYINVDATYGLRNFGTHVFINFQDAISTSIGVRLW